MPKHTPNTTEPSYPHVGSSGQKEVDMLSFGPGGKKDNEETKKNSHVTDPNIVDWGQQKQDADAKKTEQKKNEPKPSP